MRLQLALNVTDLDESIAFYEKMFATPVNKVKPGYANFAIENPPLKLVLFESSDDGGSLNHLGVEVDTADQVEDAEKRISDSGTQTVVTPPRPKPGSSPPTIAGSGTSRPAMSNTPRTS